MPNNYSQWKAHGNDSSRASDGRLGVTDRHAQIGYFAYQRPSTAGERVVQETQRVMTGALFLVQAIRAKFNDPELSRDGFNYFLDQLMESLRAEAGQESVEGFVEWLTSAQIRQS